MSERWRSGVPLAYAHQGGAREAPSSTVFACQAALQAGATAIELDVHRTKDGHLVVCHDKTVDRTTNGSGPISEHTLDDLRRLDNAYWWVPGEQAAAGRPEREYLLRGRAPEDATLRVATLDEILDAFPATRLNLDIKQTSPVAPPYERQLADALRARERTHDVIVASFHDRALAAFRAAAPDIATSMGPRDVVRLLASLAPGAARLIRFPPTVVAAQLPTHQRGVPLITRRLVDVAHRVGLAVHAWTIDEPAAMHRLLDMGVDGIITDRPSVLRSVLDGR